MKMVRQKQSLSGISVHLLLMSWCWINTSINDLPLRRNSFYKAGCLDRTIFVCVGAGDNFGYAPFYFDEWSFTIRKSHL